MPSTPTHIDSPHEGHTGHVRRDLLAELDKITGVCEKRRSAVLRQLASDFVGQRREREINAQYERAYKRVEALLGEEFEGWEGEGIGPPGYRGES